MMSMNDEELERLDGIGKRDHSNTSEYRIYGPPGTGKTTQVARHMASAAKRFGSSSVLATSFSRATAAELSGRDVPIDPDCVGTLHSHCYRALGNPAIAEVYVEQWNLDNPGLAITPVSKNVRLDAEDPAEDEPPKDGDRLLQQLNRCRGLMLRPERWPIEVRQFTAQWNRYKAANGLLDFCDLIETALRDMAAAPRNPAVIVADEAQDLNRMQLMLLRKWRKSAEYLVIAADDDQTIFSWVGASPEALLDPDIPEDHKVFLKQSHRVPRAVHAVGDRMIRQVTRRQEKTYAPRPYEGALHRLLNAGYRSPEYGILKTAEQHLTEGKKIMFLGSCSYMLRPLIAVLRKHAIPFHNPYVRAMASGTRYG